jgi:hypothetical protein
MLERIRQNHLTNLKPLKMVLCSSCDGVPLKSKKKTSGPPVYQDGLFELSIDRASNLLDNTYKKISREN